MKQVSPSSSPSTGWSRSQFLTTLALAVVFWFFAACAIRMGGALFSAENPYRIFLYLVSAPGAYAFLYLTERLARLKPQDRLRATAVLAYAATMLDGVALLGFRELYGGETTRAYYGAAWLLWGVAAGLWMGDRFSPNTGDYDTRLSSRQQGQAFVLGITFWLVGVLSIRTLGPAILTEGNPWLPGAFLASWASSLGAILWARKLMNLQPGQLLRAIVMISCWAMLADALFLTFYPNLYGSGTDLHLYAAAWLLWTFGVGLLLAHFMTPAKAQG